MADPAVALLDSARGDFFLTLLGFLVIFIVGICGYMVYQTQKNWERSTDRIVEKICTVIERQNETTRAQNETTRILSDLVACYKGHDTQAKEIKADVGEVKVTAQKIETVLESRPCINGRHK